jgi:hypothetical protein
MTMLLTPLVEGRKRYLLIGAATLLSVLVYLGVSAASGQAGFPLDDAWIHQTYARSLLESGRWEYVPGQVSAGSTAPLWTLLLSVGYFIKLPYLAWAYLMGCLSLLALGMAAMKLWRLLWPATAAKDWLAGLAIIFTWPLVWAAVSGMETLLFAAVGLWIVTIYVETWANSKRRGNIQLTPLASDWPVISLGFLSGLLILIRPDGLVLVLLIVAGLGLERTPLAHRVRTMAIYVGVLSLPLIPYLTFNLRTSGHVWPNTFYAKQAEYAVLLAQPFMVRLGRLLFLSLGGPEIGWLGSSGAHLFLLPGLIAAAWLALERDGSKRQLGHTLPLLWAAGHVLLYSWRLPVTYQHGRYLFAALPIWVLYGLYGWLWLFAHLSQSRVTRLLKMVASLSFIILLLLFWLLGAQTYATDVAFIEGEMVNVARWLNQNTPSEALIAAHDIGAIGYFAKRPLIDLAGLISPEIIPRLADETAVDQYILASDAAYLVTAPGWTYERVIAAEAVVPLYQTGFEWTQEQGVNNMTVYRLPAP